MRIKLDKSILQLPESFTVIATFVYGMLVHLFGIVNIIHNNDDINAQPIGVGATVSSGRWMLGVSGNVAYKLFGTFNLHYLNGMAFIVFLALSAGILVSIFKIRNKYAAALIGLLFVSYPAATCTLFYNFTAPYYGFAILLAVTAAWILPRYKIAGFVASAVLTMLSLAIYQSYFPLTAAILVLSLIKSALNDDCSDAIHILKKCVYRLAGLLSGLVLYFVSVKISLAVTNKELNTYKGISEMGQAELGDYPKLLWDSFKSFLTMPLKNTYALSESGILKLSYLAVGLMSICIVGYTLYKKKKDKFVIALTLLLGVCFPIAVNLIVVMCPGQSIRTMMAYPFVLVLCAPIILWDTLPSDEGRMKHIVHIAGKCVAAVVLLAALSNSYIANVNYTALYYSNQQAENFFIGLVSQVRMTDGFDENKKWALVGEIDDPLFDGTWAHGIPEYGGNPTSASLINGFARDKFFSTYIGYDITFADDSEIKSIKTSEEFLNMPCWPAAGSITVTDDYVIIKFDSD